MQKFILLSYSLLIFPLLLIPAFTFYPITPITKEAKILQTPSPNEFLEDQIRNCTPTGSRNVDRPNPVNHGILDDRTCFYDYEEKNIDGQTFGSYRIKAGSLTSTTSTLSPRMERKFSPRAQPVDGAYQLFKGTFRIESVGGERGTYFIQAKGKHINHIDPDPAIALIIAREVVENGDTFFDLYREEITKRGGRFSNNGRKDVLLTRVKKNENFDVEMKTGFQVDQQGNITKHYVNVKIKNITYYYNTPRPDLALETGIRYGAYSVSSGTARIFVSNTSYVDN